jgi:hypothetical protein
MKERELIYNEELVKILDFLEKIMDMANFPDFTEDEWASPDYCNQRSPPLPSFYISFSLSIYKEEFWNLGRIPKFGNFI